MARRKAKDKQEENAIQSAGELPIGPGAVPLPSYPYGSKKPTKTPDSPAIPTTDPPIEREQSNEAEGNDASTLSIETEAAVTATDDANTDTKPPTPEPDAKPGDQGDTLPTVIAAVESVLAEPYTREGKLQATNRWAREGIRPEVENFIDEVRKACRKQGMTRGDANEYAWDQALEKFPPPERPPPVPPKDSPVETASEPVESPSAADLPGLYSIPPDWPTLPDNAALQVELGWVQSQRLAVVEERGNATIVRLERASSPAPSKAALGWLETSIRSYAKYIEVAAKTLAGAADEAEATRRERMRLDDIRALLDEMHRDAV